jgi:hypothetical protein
MYFSCVAASWWADQIFKSLTENPHVVTLAVYDAWSMQMTTWLRLWDFNTPSPGQNGAALVLNGGSIPGQMFYYSNKDSSETNAGVNSGFVPTGKW